MKIIILLRAINLGKLNKVSMYTLKNKLDELGYLNIKTLLQSGNVSLECEQFDQKFCELQLYETFGFKIPIIITNHQTLVELSNHELFNENTMILFTNEHLSKEVIEQLHRDVPETFDVIDQCILINYVTPYHATRFNNNWFERKLKLISTIRNRNTVLKMIESFK